MSKTYELQFKQKLKFKLILSILLHKLLIINQYY